MYEDIKLALYLDVAHSQNYRKLVVTGNPSDDECFEAFERILVQNAKVTGEMTFLNYFEATKAYAFLLNKYNAVKYSLLLLLIEVNKEVIEYVGTLGYRIDTTSSEAYALSLKTAFYTSNNLISKITAKQKEVANFGKDQDPSPPNIGKLIASVNAALEWKAMDVDTLLSEYNEFKSIIRKKNGTGRTNR